MAVWRIRMAAISTSVPTLRATRRNVEEYLIVSLNRQGRFDAFTSSRALLSNSCNRRTFFTRKPPLACLVAPNCRLAWTAIDGAANACHRSHTRCTNNRLFRSFGCRHLLNKVPRYPAPACGHFIHRIRFFCNRVESQTKSPSSGFSIDAPSVGSLGRPDRYGTLRVTLNSATVLPPRTTIRDLSGALLLSFSSASIGLIRPPTIDGAFGKDILSNFFVRHFRKSRYTTVLQKPTATISRIH
jgi:hypothetical protein